MTDDIYSSLIKITLYVVNQLMIVLLVINYLILVK